MEIKDKILKIHRDIREDKEAPIAEADFIQSLIRPDDKSIDDSFKGKHYKNKFLDAIETEFSICFPGDVFEKKWVLDDFVSYVEERRQKPDANLKLAQKRVQENKRADANLFLIMNVILITPAFFMPSPWSWAYLIIPIILNTLILLKKQKDIEHYQNLIQKIEKENKN